MKTITLISILWFLILYGCKNKTKNNENPQQNIKHKTQVSLYLADTEGCSTNCNNTQPNQFNMIQMTNLNTNSTINLSTKNTESLPIVLPLTSTTQREKPTILEMKNLILNKPLEPVNLDNSPISTDLLRKANTLLNRAKEEEKNVEEMSKEIEKIKKELEEFYNNPCVQFLLNKENENTEMKDIKKKSDNQKEN